MLTVLAGDVLADRIGDGPPQVLALHGWGRTGADFAPILAGTDALAVHLPGFGPSAEPPQVWGSGEYADQVAYGLQAGGPATGPFVVVGHSFGGRVAVRLAARHPELVSALVLTGVPLIRTTPPTVARGMRAMKRLRAVGLIPQSVLDRYRKRAGSADYRAADGVMRDILVRVIREDYREDLARIDAPAHLVWGELDDAAPLDGAHRAAELLTDATVEVVPGAGHLLDGALADALRLQVLALTEAS